VRRRGVSEGDTVLIEIERDADAAGVFESLSFTHRNGYARWIAEEKKEETRERRVAKAVEMLRAGVKHP
jgi:uncharacterized protein YdeI (YjbR/CyaY-like superfamily)